ncbi:MAG TPA: hypothetical protein VF841_16525 [Anaeromyxobacter sp.]
MIAVRAQGARATAVAVAVAVALAVGGCAGAKSRRGAPRPAGRTAFEVPGHGGLEISLPPGWTATPEPSEPTAPRRIRLEAPGAGFVAIVSPFWNPGEPEDPAARADNARLLAEIARRGVLAGSVEQEIPLQELAGEGVRGFWFSATDRELAGRDAGPGEWRHLLQGVAAVGPLVVVFDLLDNAPGPQREQLLALVRGARHVGGGETGDAEAGGEAGGDDAGGDEGAEEPATGTVPLRVEVRGKAWSVLVDLPGFRILRTRSSRDGVETLVVGHHPEQGIVASVIVRSAGRARDAAACREADLANLRAAQATLGELRLGAAGDVARATYVVPEVAGKPVRQLNGHAWLYRDDVCANVHLSKAAPEKDDAAALERILASVRYGTDL